MSQKLFKAICIAFVLIIDGCSKTTENPFCLMLFDGMSTYNYSGNLWISGNNLAPVYFLNATGNYSVNYDAQNRISKVVYKVNGETTLNMNYDGNSSRLLNVTYNYFNQISGIASYSYNKAEQLTGVEYVLIGLSTPYLIYTYQYPNITTHNPSSSTYSFGLTSTGYLYNYSYSYQYDTKINPLSAFDKFDPTVTPNNVTQETISDGYSTFTYSYTYTYTNGGYPLSKKRSDGSVINFSYSNCK